MEKQYSIAIVGATGAVGHELIRLLRQRRFPVKTFRMLASVRSAGKTITFEGETFEVAEATADAFKGCDLAIFAASSGLSRELAPAAVAAGALVIDCSSAFRMDPEVPLVIPEINADVAKTHKGIIANPNCTGAVAQMALYPLHQTFGLKRVIAASYQAVSGAGQPAMEELDAQTRAWADGKELRAEAFPHPIAFNLIPKIDVINDDGYTGEEAKMRNEMRKIMGLPELKASCTCVRVPVFRAHSVVVNAEFEDTVDLSTARQALEKAPGIELRDDPSREIYPMPRDYGGEEICGVGRLRVDQALENGLAFWVVGDQLWKGAALNAVQIAELATTRGLLG